ncbi:hypothetical protein FDUTEX481_05499 [Tolypothrix sp. PCC 7601]|nr:hypothetical protein FDUTEX481_05499 [Tolypothrix sp. PCC 7601]
MQIIIFINYYYSLFIVAVTEKAAYTENLKILKYLFVNIFSYI